MSPGRLLDIQGVGDPVAVAQDNFEVVTEEIFKVVPTYQSGSPTPTIGPPTAGDHVLDELWKDAWNGGWRCTVAGTPGTWRQEKAAIRAGEPGSGTIPVGYQIEDSTDNYRRKWHVGAYVWEPVSVTYAFQRVTGFTGGGSTNLDGIATTSLAVGTIAQFTVSSSRYIYRLRAGTEAELSPFIIRPDDYDGAANTKVWERVWRSEFPADISRDITGLTGSTAADLNGIPTVNLAVGSIVWFLISGALVCYRLRTGTDSTSSPTVIRPVDFQSVTNPKIWERLVNVSTPGDVMIGNNNLSEVSTSATKRASSRTNIDTLWADDIRGTSALRWSRGGIKFFQLSGSIAGTAGVAFGTGPWSVVIGFTSPRWVGLDDFFATHSSGNNRFKISINSSTQFTLTYTNGAGATTVYTLIPDVPLVDGESYLITITDDRATVSLYINGTSDRDLSGQVVSVDSSGSSAIDIGSGNANAWSKPIGQSGVLFALRAFNRALSASDVLDHLKIGFTNYQDQWGVTTALIDSSTNNGGFETAGGGGADVFGSWSETLAGSSTLARDTVVFNSGVASCKMVIDSSGNTAKISQTVTAFKRYRVKFYAKVDDASANPQISVSSISSVSPTTSWVQYSVEVELTSGSSLFLQNGSNSANRTLWIDDVSVFEIGAVLDVDIHNSDPGQSLTVRDRSSNSNHGTASSSSLSQISRVRQFNIADALSVGSSTLLTKLLSATAALDFGSISAASQADLTITVTGALVGDSVALGLPAAPTAGIVFNAFVSASDTVKVRATNITAGVIDPASATYRVTVFQF